MRKTAVVAAIVLAGVGVGGTAFAGEVDGNGNETPIKGHIASSICSFSGLDDGSEGGIGGPGQPPQNWGQIPKDGRDFLTSIGENPGVACRGNVSHEG